VKYSRLFETILIRIPGHNFENSRGLETIPRKLTSMLKFPGNEKSGKIGLDPTLFLRSCVELEHPISSDKSKLPTTTNIIPYLFT